MKYSVLPLTLIAPFVACGGTVILGGIDDGECKNCDGGVVEAAPLTETGADAADAGGDADAAPDVRVCSPLDAGARPDGADGGDACGADLENDPDNCGSCGHDCGGGFCDQGSCHVPEPLALGQGQPSALTLVGRTLYWTNYASDTIDAGSVASHALDACPNDIVNVATNLTAPYPLRATSDALYWTTDGTDAANHADGIVQRVGLSGGAITSLTAPNLARASDLLVAGGSLIWTQQGVAPLYQSGGGVFACPSTGCVGAPTVLAQATAGSYRAFGLESDGNNLYWTMLGSLGANYADGAIFTCPLTGCVGNPTAVATGERVASQLRVVGPDLYWTTMGTPPASVDGTVMHCTRASCDATKTTLVSAQKSAFRLAVDATHVYFTNIAGTDVVRRVPIGGGPVTTIYRGASGAFGLALDDQYVYFTVIGTGSADGAIYRVKK